MSALLKLNLNRPIAVVDLETTGVDVTAARIISMGLTVIDPEGNIASDEEMRFNPGMPIPPGATRVNGLTDEMVQGCPTFAERAVELKAKLDGCDLAGFNIERYDLPLLRAEFARAGITDVFQDAKVIDAFTIFKKNLRHTLTSAVRYYLDRSHEGAHGALADAHATAEVLLEQIRRHGLPRTAEELDAYCHQKGPSFVDRDGVFVWKGAEVLFNMGKHTGVPLREAVEREADYLRWMLESHFTDEVKAIVQAALGGVLPQPDGNPSPKTGT